MKQYLIFIFLLLPASVFAQNLILRNGEVYRFDESTKKWSESPLPIKSSLSINDSIKANTCFTVEFPLSLKTFFRQRTFTFNVCKEGVRLSTQLKEKEDRYSFVNTRVVDQGDYDALIEHLEWLRTHDDEPSPINVELEIYDSNSWQLLKDNTLVSKSNPKTLCIINNEPYSVYVYILWKDSKWDVFGCTNKCLEISSYSYYDESITLDEYFGKHSILLLLSKVPISEHNIISLIAGNHKAIYNNHLNESFGSKMMNFTLEN